MRLELEGVGRLVEGDPGPERADRHAQRAGRGPDVLLDEEQLAGCRLGRQQGEVVLAQHAGPHETEQEPELAGRHPAVGERHRRLGQATAGRDDLVEQVGLELAHQRGERTGVGADPARPVDDAGALDDARQRAPEGGRQGRHDAGHGRRVGGFGGAQLCGVERARRSVQARDGDPLDLGPIDQPAPRGLLGTSAGDRGGRPQRGPDQEAGLPDAVVTPLGPSVVAAGHRLRPIIGSRPRVRPARRRGSRLRTAGRQERGTCPRHRSSTAGGSRRPPDPPRGR